MATVNHHNTQKLIGGNRAGRHYDKFLNTIPIDDPGVTAGLVDDVVPETNKVWYRSLEAGFGLAIDVVETDHHPRAGPPLNKIVLRVIGGGLGGLKLLEGEVFIGNSLDEPISTGATAEGQVVLAGSGPGFDFAPGFLSANFVTNTPSIVNNISSTNVQATLIEIASERSYIHVDVIDPTVNNDGVDTASISETFKIGDLWINTVTDNVWQVTDISSGAAVWVRSAGVASAFVYKGDVDASNSGILPSNPVAGDWYRINIVGGTDNFNGAWDANGEPNGATFAVGDAIVFGDDGDWHKIDNTDPIITGGNGINISSGPNFIASVDADEVTITASGGSGIELAVFGGLINQVLAGQGVASDAIWSYLSSLYDSNGNLIINGSGVASAVNDLAVTNSATGNPVTIKTEGTDTNIDLTILAKGLGRINLDGTLWPNGVAPLGSIIVANAVGDLSYEPAPDGSGDQILIFNDTTNTLEWTDVTNVGGNAFTFVTGDTGTATADTTSDTLNVIGGEGITTTASDDPENLTIDLNITELTPETILAPADVFVFYDDSASAHRKITLTDLSNNLDQNLFETFTADTGSTTANIITDTLNVVGGIGIDTTIVGDVLTITATTSVPANQNLWETISSDSGSTVANIVTDTLTIIGGTGISTAIVGDVLTITNTNPNVDQSIWLTFNADSGTTAANTTTDALTITGGVGIDTTIVGDVLTIDANNLVPANQNIWLTISADTGSTVANTTTDVLTITGGTLVSTTVVGDTLTIDASVSVGDLIDVDLTSLTNGDILVFNSISGNWEVGSDTGEANTASNVGLGGVGLFLQKVGVDLQFKNINAGSNKVTITDDVAGSPPNNEIDIDIVPGNILTSTLNNDENWAADQNLWLTFDADTGTTAANTTTDVLTVTGGVGIDTSIVGDVLTINANNLVPANQNLWETITADSGSTTADTTIDNLTIAGGPGISTDIVGDVLTITSGAATQNLFESVNLAGNFLGDAALVADSPTDSLTISGGVNIEITGTAATDTLEIDFVGNYWETIIADTGTAIANIVDDILTISGGSGISTSIVGDILTITNDLPGLQQNLWETVVLGGNTSGDASLVADSINDTLTLVGGTNITLTGTASTDTIEIDFTGILGDPDQNLWETFNADTGSTSADILTDTLTIAGGTNVTTTIAGDVLTIDATPGNIWLTISSDSGSTSANTPTDVLTVTGGTNVTTSIVGDVLTIDSPLQNLWETITADTGAAVANITTDTLTIAGGTNVTTTIVGDILTINATAGAQNLWATFIADSGTTSANTIADIINIVGGTGIDTTIVGDVLTIDANNLVPANQNLWETIIADTGSTTANIVTDTLTIVGGTDIDTSIAGDILTINTTAESNTASNVGVGGVGVFKQKVGVDLQFKNVNTGSNKVTVTNDAANNEIDIDIVPGNILTSTLNNDENWAADQNLFETVTADTGSTTANITIDTLTVTGGVGIDTTIVGDVLTIDANNQAPANQNIWLNVNADSGTTAANTTTDTLIIVGGTDISTTIVGDTLTINTTAENNTASNIGIGGVGVFKQKVGIDLQFKNINAGSNKVTITDDVAGSPPNNEIDIDIVPGNILTSTLNNDENWAADQNLWETITADSGSTIANIVTDNLTIAGGMGITTAISGDTLTITAMGTAPANQFIWETITADTGSTVANTVTDILTVTGGTLISTTISGDTLTIDASLGINDLTDVDTTGIVNNNILVFNSTSGNWEVGTDQGEANTASNVGLGGVGVFNQKTGINFEFKNINAGSNKVTVTDDNLSSPPNNEIDIDIVPGNILTSTLNNDENWAADQNLWLNVTGDTGTTAANTTTDTLTVTGGVGIDTTVVGDVLTIDANNSVPANQNIWLTISSDSGSTVANTVTDTLTIVGGTLVSTAIIGDVLTINTTAENNTASNIGVGGVGVFDGKVGVDLQFRNINAGSNKVTVILDNLGSPPNNEIDIDIVPGNILTSTLNNDENWAADQNIWLTFNADTGTTAANTTTDALTVTGGTGIDTVIVGDVLTINANNLVPANQNLFETVSADTGSTTADITTDTLTIVGGTLVSTTIVGDTLTIDTTAELNTASNIGIGGVGLFKQKVGADLQFKNINAGSNKVTITDDVAGSPPNNEVDIDIVPGNILTSTLNNDANFAADQNLFETVTADTGSTTANTITDTLNIVGGDDITTSITGDTVSIILDVEDSFTITDTVGDGLVVINTSTTATNLDILLTTKGAGDVLVPNGYVPVDPLALVTKQYVDATDQNLWETVSADTGSTTANTLTDTLTIAGGTGVDTVIVGDTLTINAGPGAPANQNLFETVTADTGSTTANTTTDTLTIVGGTLVSTTIVGDTLTIDASLGINDLIDVDTTGITNGNILVFNSTSGNWEVGTDIDTGEVNTASNVGVGGVGVFKQKTGVNFEFKNINAGSNKVTITDDSAGSPPNNEIDIDIVPGNILTSTLNNDANFAADQNIWLTITADTGSTAANTTTDTLTVTGGTGIDTSVVGDVLTITATNVVGGLGQSGTLSFFHDSGTENVFLSIDNHHQEPSGPQSQGTSVPAIMPFDGEVYAITFINRLDSVETDLEFYINGTVALTWSIVNKKWARKSDGLSALSFSAGDQIGLFAKKVTGQKPDTVSVYMYYTFTSGTEEEGGTATL